MGWATRQYSDEQINDAGRTLISRHSNPLDIGLALPIIDNWRACHQFPLNTMQMRLRRKVDELHYKDSLVSQRIKRLPAIESKLRRLRSVSLVQMQDIGGCRAVVPSIKEVYKLNRIYRSGRIRHEIERENDYIMKPSSDGYRSLHLIFQYYSDRNDVYNGQRIEVQLRSIRQHAWATAVEAVDAFASQLLKINQGDKMWARFFMLMGCCIAITEKTPLVLGAPDRDQLTQELRDLAHRLNVIDRLSAIRVAIRASLKMISRGGGDTYLIDLDIDKRRLRVMSYPKHQRREALDKLAEMELEYRAAATKGLHKDILLASASSVTELRRAYPNYYADTDLFLKELQVALGE